MDIINIYCDGGARGNPGPAAYAFIVFRNGKLIKKESNLLGKTTNNFAEYSAVLKALKWLEKNLDKKNIEKIIFKLDSELVVKQLNGFYKVKSKNLRPITSFINNIKQNFFMNIYYEHISRNKNYLADFLVNQELNKKFISRPPKKNY